MRRRTRSPARAASFAAGEPLTVRWMRWSGASRQSWITRTRSRSASGGVGVFHHQRTGEPAGGLAGIERRIEIGAGLGQREADIGIGARRHRLAGKPGHAEHVGRHRIAAEAQGGRLAEPVLELEAEIVAELLAQGRAGEGAAIGKKRRCRRSRAEQMGLAGLGGERGRRVLRERQAASAAHR